MRWLRCVAARPVQRVFKLSGKLAGHLSEGTIWSQTPVLRCVLRMACRALCRILACCCAGVCGKGEKSADEADAVNARLGAAPLLAPLPRSVHSCLCRDDPAMLACCSRWEAGPLAGPSDLHDTSPRVHGLKMYIVTHDDVSNALLPIPKHGHARSCRQRHRWTRTTWSL